VIFCYNQRSLILLKIKMKKLLKTHFGYDRFRPLQKEIISNVLAKKDTFVLMPTGGGKSLCYQLPAMKFSGLTLVVSPLISLMKDQVDSLKANGIEAEFLNSSLLPQDAMDIRQKVKAGKTKILYVAPERLAFDFFREFLHSLKLSLIAIDEAHCISEWGHDFRPEYRNLKFFKKEFPKVPVIALTATATPKVRADIIKQLSLRKAKQFASSFDRKNLTFSVLRKKNAFEKLLALLKKHKGESVIIYCFSRRETEEIAASLKIEGIKALPYHAGLPREIRKRNQEQFIKDEARVIAATIAFGMGIDKPDVRLIVHYTFPKTLEGYYQEIGRAGRDGLPAECALLYSYGDIRKHEFFLGQMENTQEQENSRQKLNQVVEYCQGRGCRRKYLLQYFGEEYPRKNCKGCDSCLRPKTEYEATEITRKILSCILRTESRFGKKYIIDLLRGKATARITGNGHQTLSVFGIVRDLTIEEMREVINDLVSLGYVFSSAGMYPTLSVTARGIQFLKAKQSLTLSRITQKG